MRPARALVVGLVAVAAVAAVPFAGGATAVDRPTVASPDRATVGLHGYHVSVDAQVSDDGTVVAETVTWLTPGFLVLRADAGGRPGDPVGYARLNGTAFRTDVAVAVAPDTWNEWSDSRTLWAAIHFDDGDGEFALARDRSVANRHPAAERAFELGAGDGADRVLARQFEPLPVRGGAVTVRRVDLATAGYLVATPVDGEAVVGTRRLPAGSHANVTLALDESFLADRDGRFRLRLVAYHDDGDGTFGPDDRPVRVGDATVGTDVTVERVTTAATTGPPGAATTPARRQASDARVSTATPSPTAADGAATATTTASGPGFGVALALLALTASAVVARSVLSETNP